MRDILIGTAQFEARDGDKERNLERIRDLTALAAREGAEAVSFHECCITGYTFLQTLSRERLLALAEPVPGGPSASRLAEIAREHGTVVLAGLLERDGDHIHNTCVAAGPEGFLAKHRKIHTFISPYLTPGDRHTVFDLRGARAGILICYDNNLPENARITALLGAEIIFMPHVTSGTESTMPGRGIIAREVWENRKRDPVRCRQEFLGPKGREWLLKWLPARAWENGVYAVFSNAIGIDHNTVKNGNAMIIDPYGEILVESRKLDDDVVVGLCTPEKIERSSGRRYLRARRPELYARLVEPPPAGQKPVTEPGWRLERPEEKK
ncbi:MAG: nitrilase [Planctomycetes bacterium]|nr:nitrilase [Planctomycetota bacterium]